MGFLQITSTFRMAPQAILPDDAAQHFDLARDYFSNKQYDKALAEFIKANPLSAHSEVFYYIASCHAKLGHLEKAIENYLYFIQDLPNAPEREEVDGEIERLRAEIAQNEEVQQPDSVTLPEDKNHEKEEPYYKNGMEHYRKKEFREALKQFRAYAELTMNGAIFYEIAICHEQLGEDKEAVEAYQYYLEHGNPPIHRRSEVKEEIVALQKLIAKNGKKKEEPKSVFDTVPQDTFLSDTVPATSSNEKSSFLGKGKWISLALAITSFAGAGATYAMAAKKDQEHADAVNRLVDEGEAVGSPGSYRFASEAAKQRHEAELNGISSDLNTYQNTAVGLLIGGIAFAGISTLFFIADGKAEVSADVEGTKEAKLKVVYRF